MDKSRMLAKLLLEYEKDPKDTLFELRLFEDAMRVGLYKLMLNPVIHLEKKQTIVDKLFKENISSQVKQFIGFLIKDGQLKYLGKIISRFEKLAKQKNGLEMVEVISARELSILQVEKIREKVKQIFKIEPIINTVIDEKVLAGISIKVGDRVFDNTIDRQIEDLSSKLMI